MNITLYTNNSPKNYISKNLVELYNMNCQSYETSDIMTNNLIVDVSDNLLKANYLFNASFDRFYYITNIEFLDGNRARIICNIDVLMSWGSQIRRNGGIIAKQKSLANYYINDADYTVDSRRLITTKSFPNRPFDVNGGDFLLKISGG